MDSELWPVVKSTLVTLILVWAGGYTNKKPKSSVFETKACRLMMYTDQEPHSVFEARVETDACTQQRSPNPIVFDQREPETDACTQTRNHDPKRV